MSLLQVGPFWSKDWLNREYDLFKVRRKPIATIRKNAQNTNLIIEYFESYKVVVDVFRIKLKD